MAIVAEWGGAALRWAPAVVEVMLPAVEGWRC